MHVERYYLSDLTINNKRLGMVYAKNSSKIPKELKDILQIYTIDNNIIDLSLLTEEEIEVILSEIMEIDALAYETIENDYKSGVN